MTRMTMREGIKIFEKLGVDTIMKEMKKCYDRTVLRPQSIKETTKNVKLGTLGNLMFLKRKSNGKGICIDGRPQRIDKPKLETSFPTACTESTFISYAMDAKEGRDVALSDISGVFE